MQIQSLLIGAFAAGIFAGCSTHDREAVFYPVPPPPLQVGQLGVRFSPEALSSGRNFFHFALVRMDQRGWAIMEEDPELETEVRFYAERSPNGQPDASALAQFLKDGRGFVAANGQTERANFVAELVVPRVSGGALEFVIRESRDNQIVIHAPIQVTNESSR